MSLIEAAYYRRNQPLKDFACMNGSCNYFKYSAATMTGWKIMQEDTMLLKPQFCNNWSLFGVFDGHKGNHVASYLKNHYSDHLESYLKDSSPVTALKLSFISIDNMLRRLQDEIISKEDENDDVETSSEDVSCEESSEEKNVNALHFLVSETLQGEDTDKDDTDFEVLNEDEGDILSESIPLENIDGTDFCKVNENETSTVCNLEKTIPENQDLNQHDYGKNPKTNRNFKSSNQKLDKESEELQFEDTNKEDTDFDENKTLNEDEGDILSESIPLENIDGTDFCKVNENETSTVCNLEKTIPENEDLNRHDYGKNPKTNRNFKSSNQKLDKESEGTDFPGSTGTVVLFKQNKLFVANVGDSRCVASMKGKVVQLSKDHRPADPEEYKRIINAGHAVINSCIDGNLNVSRAFGDFELKTSKESERNHAVISHPHVHAVYDTDDIEFIIIASDGVWNSMSSDDVVDFVKKRRNMPLEKIIEELFDKVIAPARRRDGRGCDNITAIVIEFHHELHHRLKDIRTFTKQKDVPLKSDPLDARKKTVIEYRSETEVYSCLEINAGNDDVSSINCDEGHFTSMSVTSKASGARASHELTEKAEQYEDVPWGPINYNTLSVPVPLDVEIASEMVCSNAETRPQDKYDSHHTVLNESSSVKNHSCEKFHKISPCAERHSRNFNAQCVGVEQVSENKRSSKDSSIKRPKKIKCTSNELQKNLGNK